MLLRAPGVAIAVLVAACGGPRGVTPPTAADLRPIEALPGLVLRLPDRAREDCRISTVVRARFAGQRVIACGVVTPASPEPAWERMGHCIDDATKAGLPYLAEMEEDNVDSRLATATVAVQKDGAITVYRLGYDSDPCGGGCPQRGGTTVQRCTQLLSAKGGCNGADCAGCAHWEADTPCFFGGASQDDTGEGLMH